MVKAENKFIGTVRRAVAEDAPGIHTAHMRSIREVCAKDYRPEQIEAWGGRPWVPGYWEAIIERDLVWVVELAAAQDESQVVIGGVSHLYLDPNGRRGQVLALYLVPEAVGLGYGKTMMDRIKKEARDRGVVRLHLTATRTAKGFYESQGFVPYSAGCMCRMEGQNIEGHPMRLRL